ncbi:hypothetical protein IQQ51_00350 [Vibrio sp. OPT18]|nr:hypothetical protein [Vibrio sp. OPT18]
MNQNLSDVTAKIDALRAADFTDAEINAILSNSAPQAQPSAQADMANPESVGVYQFLKSSPSSMAVTDDMTESDRAYAKEWNKRIDKLSFFFGWKADAIGFAIILWIGWPILAAVIGCFVFDIRPKDSVPSFGFIMTWFATWFVVLVVASSYVNQKHVLPHVQFLLKKRLS